MKELAPTSALDKHMLKKMSHASAGGVKMQCWRDYFPDDERKPRATQLYKLTSDE